MGWWQLPGNKSINLGDEAFEATYEHLETLSVLYQESFQRKITIDELESLLTLSLRGAAVEFIDNFDERAVESVRIKIAKRKKGQAFKVGDIFVVPLDGGHYAFGRIINLKGSWNLAEIFAFASKTPIWSPAVIEAGQLFEPITIDVNDAFENNKWRIIDHDDHIDKKSLESLRYVMGFPGNFKIMKVNEYAPLGPITDSEAAKWPRMQYTTVETTASVIKKALKQQKLL